jgi:hypothetical protein
MFTPKVWVQFLCSFVWQLPYWRYKSQMSTELTNSMWYLLAIYQYSIHLKLTDIQSVQPKRKRDLQRSSSATFLRNYRTLPCSRECSRSLIPSRQFLYMHVPPELRCKSRFLFGWTLCIYPQTFLKCFTCHCRNYTSNIAVTYQELNSHITLRSTNSQNWDKFFSQYFAMNSLERMSNYFKYTTEKTELKKTLMKVYYISYYCVFWEFISHLVFPTRQIFKVTGCFHPHVKSLGDKYSIRSVWRRSSQLVKAVMDPTKYTWSSTYDRLPFWLTGRKSIWSYVSHIFINSIF